MFLQNLLNWLWSNKQWWNFQKNVIKRLNFSCGIAFDTNHIFLSHHELIDKKLLLPNILLQILIYDKKGLKSEIASSLIGAELNVNRLMSFWLKQKKKKITLKNITNSKLFAL